jgi:hypothetical protein
MRTLRRRPARSGGRSAAATSRCDYSEPIKCVATRTHKMHKRNREFLRLLCLLVAMGFLKVLSEP